MQKMLKIEKKFFRSYLQNLYFRKVHLMHEYWLHYKNIGLTIKEIFLEIDKVVQKSKSV
jgi:hypothetical protein